MIAPFHVAMETPWTRQGEWGGTTLSRCLTYVGMQRALPEWTGVSLGYESFLHSGETTYIATDQYARFARAYLVQLKRERSPLRTFTARFADLLSDVSEFLVTLKEVKRQDEKLARYLQLHQQMQPYSYVFGYGEEQVVGQLLDTLLTEAGLDAAARTRARSAATAPLPDKDATSTLERLRRDGVDARAVDFADLVREHVQVRTDRRVLWSKVEEGMAPYLAWRAGKVSLPVRLLQEATPQEVVKGLPPRPTLEARIGTTFLAHNAQAYFFTGEEHAALRAKLARPAQPDADSVEGNCAFPGLVRGRVRIVLTSEQGDDLQKGEILVSDMTSPDLTAACSRAGAIVTDRGGILCHAALVAREMQIPCVLGTEDATQVFKTGDLVEVDAHRGIVRKIAGVAV